MFDRIIQSVRLDHLSFLFLMVFVLIKLLLYGIGLFHLSPFAFRRPNESSIRLDRARLYSTNRPQSTANATAVNTSIR